MGSYNTAETAVPRFDFGIGIYYHFFMGDAATEQVIAQIDKLKETTAYGDWDSYEAQAVGLGEREQAKECVRVIRQIIGEGFAQPLVSPISDPGVALIWRKKGHGEVDALFTPRGAAYVVIGPDRKPVMKGPISNYEKFARNVLNRFLGQ